MDEPIISKIQRTKKPKAHIVPNLDSLGKKNPNLAWYT